MSCVESNVVFSNVAETADWLIKQGTPFRFQAELYYESESEPVAGKSWWIGARD